MPNTKVVMNDDLRLVLRMARQRAKATQAQAARKAGVSEVWWSQLETGVKDVVRRETLISMLLAVKTPVQTLRKISQDDLADYMALQLDWFGAEAL